MLASHSERWFHKERSWSVLQAHCGACTTNGCSCKLLVSNFGKWCRRLPVLPGEEDPDGSDTWLWFRFTNRGMLRWTCVVCHAEVDFGNEKDDHEVQSIQISNLLCHHKSTLHQQNLKRVFGQDYSGQVDYVVPPPELFKELLAAFQKGDAPSAGYQLPSGYVSIQKSNSMLWTMAEAQRDVRREELSVASCINILRDERHGRMHVRFRSGVEYQPGISKGYLGQSRGHHSDAIGLTQATVGVFRCACTSREHPPPGAHVEPMFHEDTFRHACDVTEAISIDSAENEVVSAWDMSRDHDGLPAPFPNCMHVLRDLPHSARRVLSRLWKACPFLDFVYKLFILISSIIQWSDELRQLYAECSRESTDSATSSTFCHMRAAMHRIESWISPLSRCVLDPSGGSSNEH